MENAREGLIRHETHPRGASAAEGGAPGDMCLGEYVDRIAKELHERVEHQRAVLRKALGESDAGGGKIPYCPLVDCARIERLRSAIRETVGVLEETRSAFKSKRLEVMRRKLCEILAER
ncbi:MAG TPA: hypothetical protein DD658_07670 [Deltaproteobacteria bacterium]|nr:hypothetical protein [Deltaproteobacteria bacterium]